MNDDTRPCEAEELPYCYDDEGEPLTNAERLQLFGPLMAAIGIVALIASCVAMGAL